MDEDFPNQNEAQQQLQKEQLEKQKQNEENEENEEEQEEHEQEDEDLEKNENQPQQQQPPQQQQQIPSTDNRIVMFKAKTENVKTLTNVLLSILNDKKDGGQTATMSISENAIGFVVEEGKVFQSIIRLLATDFFVSYYFKSDKDIPIHSFRINFSTLFDCLSIYGSAAPMVSLQITFEAPGKPLELILDEGNAETKCELRTMDAEDVTDIRFGTVETLSDLTMQSSFLKEAFDELDWSAPIFTITISPQEPYFRLQTIGTSISCQIDYPKQCEIFEQFNASESHQNNYKLTLLATPVKALLNASKTRLRINKSGVLCIEHLVKAEDKTSTVVCYYILPEIAE